MMKFLKKAQKVLRSKGLKVSIGNRANEESGIALIMTLGILSILIVLALAFASNARTSSRMANANANNTSAKLIAQGACERIITMGKLAVITNVSQQAGNFNYTGYDSRTGSNNYNDNLSNLTTNLNPWEDEDYTDTDEYQYESYDGVKWVNITVNGKITGRYAYVLPDLHMEVPGISPDSAVTHNGDKDGSGTVINAQDESTYSSKRYGVYPHEISLKNLVGLDGSLISTDNVQKLSSDAVGVGTLTDASNWNTLGGFPIMYDGSHLNISTQSIKDKFEDEYFYISGNPDPEAFWIDDNNNTELDANELYIRFNLARTDWDNNWASDGNGSEGDLDGSLVVADNDHRLAFMNDYILADAGSWVSGHADPNGKGINWLNSYSGGGDDTNNFVNIATKQKQIAANLIDYCDSDSVPTSDKDPSKWTSTNKPTFTGNDLHPMITEIWAICEMLLVSDDADKDGNVDWHYTIKTWWGAEVCNPYTVELPGDAVIQVCSAPGVHNFNPRPQTPYGVSGDTENVGMKQEDISSAQSRIRITGPFPPGSYTAHEVAYETLLIDYEAPDGVGAVQRGGCKFQFGINTIRLLYNGTTTLDDSSVESPDAVDIAYIKEDWNDPATGYGHVDVTRSDHRSPGVTSWKTGRLHIHVNDPRQNLNEKDWSGWGYQTNYDGYATNPYGKAGDARWPERAETPNKKNPVETSSSVGDEDQQSDNRTNNKGIVSTSYIRNGPMLSPWEIGAIHRAAPWETINLKKFDANTMDVMDDYVDGDLNLLDQVKMTSDDEMMGKFNLNTTSGDCIRALVMDVRVGSTYKDPEIGGTKITKDEADKIAASFSANKSGVWLRRGRLGNITSLVDETLAPAITQDTDAKREEIIGKIVNLCKTPPVNTPTTPLVGGPHKLILIAQAIKDVGDVTIYKDLDLDGNVGVADETQIGYDLNGDGKAESTSVGEVMNTKFGVFDLNADEILSEIKLYLTIEEITPGNWKINEKKFIE